MRMLRRGEISVTEAATIALVSRQRVREWCRKAGVDAQQARSKWLTHILDRLNRQDNARD